MCQVGGFLGEGVNGQKQEYNCREVGPDRGTCGLHTGDTHTFYFLVSINVLISPTTFVNKSTFISLIR